jgi:hypothetical protein
MRTRNTQVKEKDEIMSVTNTSQTATAPAALPTTPAPSPTNPKRKAHDDSTVTLDAASVPSAPAGAGATRPSQNKVLTSLLNYLVSPPVPSEELASALLFQTEQVAFTWPAFASLRSAARASKAASFRLAVSTLVSEARLVFGACYLLSRGPLPPPGLAHDARPGAALHLWIKTLIMHGSATLSTVWHWSLEQTQYLHAHLMQLAAPCLWTLSPLDHPPLDPAAIRWDLPARLYPATLCAFLHSLRVGAPWSDVLRLFAALPIT